MLLVVTVFGAITAILHGIYFDLDFSQIRRLSIWGVIFTTIVVFPAIIFFEYVFDWNNMEEIRYLTQKIKSLETRLNKLKDEKHS